MRSITTIAIATLVALAGCAADQPDAGPPAPSAIAHETEEMASPSESPVALTREEAAKRYLEVVRPYNEALEELEQAVNGGQSFEEVRDLAQEVAEANQAHIDELQGTPWPNEVRPAIEELVAESTAAQPYWEHAAEAETQEELVEALLATAEHDGGSAAEQIRELLDLEKYDERDYS